MKAKSVIKKQKRAVKKKPIEKRLKSLKSSKKIKVLNLSKKSKLNKIEGIYKNYLEKYSALSQKRSILFNNLVEHMKKRKIEILKKNIND